MNSDDISKQVTEALDGELEAREQELARAFGAVEVKTLPTEKQIASISEDKGKEEADPIHDIPPEPLPETTKIELPKTDEPPKTKDALVKSIMELQASLGRNDWTESKLRREKKASLESLLASFYSNAADKVQDRKESEEENMKTDTNVIVENLYMMNLMFSSLLEKGAASLKEKTYNIALLEGMCDNLRETKSELITILRRIYQEHHEVIKRLATPTALYLGYMTKTMGVTVMSNLEKKKTMSNEKSEKK